MIPSDLLPVVLSLVEPEFQICNTKAIVLKWNKSNLMLNVVHLSCGISMKNKSILEL